MSDTLEAREQVVDLCLHLVRRGFFAATGGNLALRLDAERIAVTPSALDYYQMGPEDVCILRLADLHQLEGDRAPSVETGLHARVLRRFPAAGCSLHTHQPLASACTLLGEALSVDDPERWLGSSPLLDLEDPKLRLCVRSLVQLCKTEREKALAVYGFVKRLTYLRSFKMGPRTARGCCGLTRGRT